jgi:hypothetical protein
MEKESTPAPPAEDTTCNDIKGQEKAPPTQSEDKKSVEMTASSLDEPSKVSKPISNEEKSDDEYPQGLALYFIYIGLCLAVFLLAIGKSPFLSAPQVKLKS